MPWRIGATAPAVGNVAALAADSELWAHGYASQTGRVAGRYGLWFVVRTGVDDVAPRTSPSSPAWLWTMSNSPASASMKQAWAFTSWKYSAWRTPSTISP